MRYIKAWIHKYIMHIESPSAHCMGYKYEWDALLDSYKVTGEEMIEILKKFLYESVDKKEVQNERKTKSKEAKKGT